MTKRKRSKKKLKKQSSSKRKRSKRKSKRTPFKIRKTKRKSKRTPFKIRKTKRKSKRKRRKSKGMQPYLDKETVLKKNPCLEYRYIDLIKEYSDGPLSKQNVLEIGSGDGRITFMLASYFRKWYALEPSSEMVNRAKKIKPKEITNVEFYQANAEGLPFLDHSNKVIPDNFIDIVLYTNSFHFIRKDKALSEAYRVLKDNGTMIIFEPSKHFGADEIRIGSPTFDQKLYDKVLKRRKPTIRYINNIYKMPEWKQVFSFLQVIEGTSMYLGRFKFCFFAFLFFFRA